MFHCTIKVLKTGISQLVKSLKNRILEGYDIAYDLVDPLRQIYFAIYIDNLLVQLVGLISTFIFHSKLYYMYYFMLNICFHQIEDLFILIYQIDH